jgi:mono/diheme cytochrome c family protein
VRRLLLALAALVAAAVVWLWWPPDSVELTEPSAAELDALAKRGEYVYRLAGCRGCHTQDDGPELAGGREVETHYGIFRPPNITPDVDTGIGSWSAADFVRALRYGRSPDGGAYLPAFPYPSYSGMTLDDMLALYAYLRTVPAVSQANAPAVDTWYLRGGLAARVWQRAFYTPAPEATSDGGDDAVARGRYIATALGHCAECHTPRDRHGVPIAALGYSGTPDGPDGDAVPNITPDREDGIGRWRATALREFLATGMKPDGDFASGAMEMVIENTTQHLTREDLGALVAYLRSLPAVPSAPKE